MTRPSLFWLPCFGLALSSFSACGGVSTSDLFSSSPGGGSAAGSSSKAGEPGELGGESAGGGDAAGGTSAEAGESSGGKTAEAGATSGGGSSAGSASEAGSSTGGASAGAGQGGNPGGAGDATGGAGRGGGSNEPTCQELNARAAQELAAAQVCNLAADAKQCTGKVENICGCQVPVQRDESPETKAYEATLKEIEKKNCKQICPAIACAPVNYAQCKATAGGGVMGTCTSFGFQQ